MAKKRKFSRFKHTEISEFERLFRQVFESRSDPKGLRQDDPRPHLLICGTGSHIEIGDIKSSGIRFEIGTFESGADRPTVLITGNGVGAFRELVILLATTLGIDENVGMDFIENSIMLELQKLAASPPEKDSAWKDRTKEFIQVLRLPSKSHKVYIPIVNLTLDADLTTIGKVTLLKTETAIEEIRSIQPEVGRSLEYFRNSTCCASVVVECHESKAKEVAYDTVRKYLNLLRCYTPFLYGTNNQRRIGMFDDLAQSRVPAVISSGEGDLVSAPSEVHGYLIDYELGQKPLALLRKYGAFDYLLEVLNKKREDRSDLELVLATAIWWIGSGNHRYSPPEQIVAMTTGLEALLIQDKSATIADDISFRVGVLLGVTPDDRERKFKRMKEIYEIRSQVVHNGLVDIPVDCLEDLRYLSLAVLVEMAKHARDGWTKVSDLIDGSSAVKFGGNTTFETCSPIPRGPCQMTITQRCEVGEEPIFFRMQS